MSSRRVNGFVLGQVMAGSREDVVGRSVHLFVSHLQSFRDLPRRVADEVWVAVLAETLLNENPLDKTLGGSDDAGVLSNSRAAGAPWNAASVPDVPAPGGAVTFSVGARMVARREVLHLFAGEMGRGESGGGKRQLP